MPPSRVGTWLLVADPGLSGVGCSYHKAMSATRSFSEPRDSSSDAKPISKRWSELSFKVFLAGFGTVLAAFHTIFTLGVVLCVGFTCVCAVITEFAANFN